MTSKDGRETPPTVADGIRPQVIWFKRDLRVHDHEALSRAAACGPVLPLYVVEPAYWALDDTSYRQFLYHRACIEDLASKIETMGGALVIRVGSVVDVFDELADAYGIFDLWAHQETGNAWTFGRDQAVRRWCRERRVIFREPLQFGVWRGSAFERDGWSKRWDALMAAPCWTLPSQRSWMSAPTECLPEPDALGLKPDGIVDLQPPGRDAAHQCLQSFLTERGRDYRTAMSSPVTGETACSRLSPHLAYGSLSMREAYQATVAQIDDVSAWPKADQVGWLGSLKSFIGRLHWHCHFMQKLEQEPELEELPMARSYTGLHGDKLDRVHLTAFERGRTGYPFVDACMRYLRATGWINFRMRAMLQSFASYNLWLPWQVSGNVLARLFTDYEPGIHWPQTQMQSGVTGINTLRIYSPIKQGREQDPGGGFTRQWVPELASIDDAFLQEPWKAAGSFDYPAPIIDHVATGKAARQKIWAIRKTPEARAEAEDVYRRHGSRKRPSARRPPKSKATS